MSNDPDMIQKHGHRDPFKILYTFFLSCHQRCCWLLHFFVIVVLLLSVGIVVVAVANHLICDSWMFLKFCWSIGLSFSLYIHSIVPLRIPRWPRSAFHQAISNSARSSASIVTACHSRRCPAVRLRTNYMSFSQSRALEAGFDAGQGAPDMAWAICGCSILG